MKAAGGKILMSFSIFQISIIFFPSWNESVDNWMQKKSQSFVFGQREAGKQEIGREAERQRVEINREAVETCCTFPNYPTFFQTAPEVSEIFTRIPQSFHSQFFDRETLPCWRKLM